ncbi:hypothetical protein CFELI_02705 [Corynebacterium felinum]|uniref:Uncharacterized protein n=1 Tax=Corynebacterium felinum TaxID=131318 RepID=A0ABU2BAQ4_9CORY|nr:hypothetical protein [Corynebacterium felinum]WJY94183.1 hypothetical protein CFELI_02705 [Corynebacterium felinum]
MIHRGLRLQALSSETLTREQRLPPHLAALSIPYSRIVAQIAACSHKCATSISPPCPAYPIAVLDGAAHSVACVVGWDAFRRRHGSPGSRKGVRGLRGCGDRGKARTKQNDRTATTPVYAQRRRSICAYSLDTCDETPSWAVFLNSCTSRFHS